MGSTIPHVDPGARQRLTARFGGEVEAWFDDLPTLLTALAERWQLELGSPIPRGSVSAVLRCRIADGRRTVLKASPGRARLAFEAFALEAWHTVHVPAVIAHDEELGALLIEAIEPGMPLDVSSNHPVVESVAELLSSLHGRCSNLPERRAPRRVSLRRLGDALRASPRPHGADPAGALRTRAPAGDAARAGPSPNVLLHGDLTPGNILDGGAERGLVAIDPAPCLGDAAFDAVDMILWQAEDLETIQDRTGRLAAATGMDARRPFTGPLELFQTEPWASVFRVPVGGEVVWFKACAPRQPCRPTRNSRSAKRGHAGEGLAFGVPDLRVARLPALYEELLGAELSLEGLRHRPSRRSSLTSPSCARSSMLLGSVPLCSR